MFYEYKFIIKTIKGFFKKAIFIVIFENLQVYYILQHNEKLPLCVIYIDSKLETEFPVEKKMIEIKES